MVNLAWMATSSNPCRLQPWCGIANQHFTNKLRQRDCEAFAILACSILVFSSSPDEHHSIFNKLIDIHGHLDMRNVTTLIWVNRKKPEIVETIVELLIEVWVSNEVRRINCCADIFSL